MEFTVVICDDKQDLLQVFELALESKFNVILASFGKECIEQLVNNQLIDYDNSDNGWDELKINYAFN